jgi:hypothetical protein
MQAAINLVDRILSFERNTLRRDLVRLAAVVRQVQPGAGFVLFGLGWIVGRTGSLVGLAIVAALVAGILLAKSAPLELSATPVAKDDNDELASLNAPVERGRQLAIATGTAGPMSLSLADLLTSTGLHIKKVEIAPQPAANGRAKKA